ncbi:MAG: ABC transporter permease [Roseivirga sp.]|nr:ABC transporter permease [Roseivirga sp.]
MKGYVVSNRSKVIEELRSLPQYKELFLTLVWKNLRLQYQSVVLGLIWGVVFPLLMSGIFFFALGSRLGSDFSDYFIFLFSGFIFWNVFASSLIQSANCMIQEHEMLKKVYFPRLLLPLSFVAAKLLDLLITLVILTGILVFIEMDIHWPAYLGVSLLSVLFLVLMAAGFCLSFSVLLVRFRGLQVIYPIIIQAIIFTSSVIYESNLTIENEVIRFLFQLNPITVILKPFREVIFFGEIHFTSLFMAFCFSTAICFSGLLWFKLEDKNLIDRL